MTGPAGSGKTWLAKAMAMQLISGKPVYTNAISASANDISRQIVQAGADIVIFDDVSNRHQLNVCMQIAGRLREHLDTVIYVTNTPLTTIL